MLATEQGTEEEADPQKADSGLCNGINTTMSKRDKLGKVEKGYQAEGTVCAKALGQE